MVSALDSGSSPGQGHSIVFHGKTLYSQCLSTEVNQWIPANLMFGGNPAMD